MQTHGPLLTLPRLEAHLARMRRGHARPADREIDWEPLVRASGPLGVHLRAEIRRLLAAIGEG